MIFQIICAYPNLFNLYFFYCMSYLPIEEVLHYVNQARTDPIKFA